MKKTILALIISSIALIAHGQSINGFKYVYLPTPTYQNGGKDIWNIGRDLRSQFDRMGLFVINESSWNIPEIKNDPCKMLIAKVNHYSDPPNAWGSFYSHVELELVDCNNESILVFTGKGKGKTLQADFKIATRHINNQLSSLQYKYDELKTPILNLPAVEKTEESEESLKTYFNANSIDEIEGIYKSYQSDTMGHYEIGIKKFESKYKAIIIESDYNYWKKGEVKAVFEPSSMKGFYSTKWYMGNKTPVETFSIMENPSLLIVEFNNAETGEKYTNKFIKMYPSADISAATTIDGIKATGSGFVVSSDGVIATNNHLIEDANRIEIHLNNEFGTNKYSASILLKDESNDVALLKIDDDEFKGFNALPYSIFQTTEIGEDVFTIGYPLNSLMGDNYKVTNGIISSNSGLKDDVRFIQMTTPIQPGNSGGPLFNKDGNVVGLTTSKLNETAVGTSIENVNYAIKAAYLINIYNMLPNKEQLSKTSTLTGKDLKDQVKVLKNYVCLIKVY